MGNNKYVAVLLVVVILLVLPMSVLATENQYPLPMSITVVVPQDNASESICEPTLPYIYPIHVWESTENNRREVVRVFQLQQEETSAQIPRSSFTRDGFYFELAEIVRREVPAHSARPHTEVIEISTQTNDLTTILSLLNSTIDFVSEDGYFGTLALDVASIRVSSQGTRSTNHNVTRTREFHNLSMVDTSLVPRTITENGRTYNLSNVEWQTQNTTVIDYTEIPNRFTAVATFSGTATRTSTIGYTTTAEYVGQISKLSAGVTEFTAHFIGVPITTVVAPTPISLVEYDANSYNHERTEILLPCTLTEEKPSADAKKTKDNHMYAYTAYFSVPIEYEAVSSLQEIPLKDNTLAQNIVMGLLIFGGMVLAFFLGRKGKLMLDAMKKPVCILLVSYMILGAVHIVYGADIPRYGFGLQNTPDREVTIHFDHQPTSQLNTENIHFHPNAQNQGSHMHFAPPRASPDYIYGTTIGTLRVERLNRNITVIAGATMRAMDFGAGHFSFTGLNEGNTALIGHNRGRTNGFFSFVRLLQYGDIIILEAGGATKAYVVTYQYIVHETNLDSLMQFGDHRLTLITCVEYQPRMRRIAVAIEL